MRKTITSIILCTAAVTAMGQKLYLAEVSSERDNNFYHYNDKNLVDSAYFESVGFSSHYDLYEYNENGKVVKTMGFDQLDGEDFYLTSYVDYTYNENGQMATRMNYNSWDKGESFSLGGLLEYKYDEKGNLTTVVTSFESWDVPGTFEPFQEERYTYDENGRLLSVESYTPDIFSGTNEMALYAKLLYTYVDETSDRIANTRTFEYYNDEETERTKEEYTYSDEGNVIDHSIYIAGSDNYTIDTEYKYAYDLTCDIQDVVMPYDFEAPVYAHTIAKNKIISKEWYGINLNNDMFGLLGTYNYSYTETPSEGVTDIVADNVPLIKLSADRNHLFVNSSVNLNDNNVIIYDLTGKQVHGVVSVGNSIDISLLRSGVYILSIAGNSVKFAK